MAQLSDLFKTEEARCSLDAVDLPENPVQYFGTDTFPPLFKSEKIGLYTREMLL